MRKVYTALFIASKREDFLNLLDTLNVNGKIELLDRGQYSVCNIDFRDHPEYHKIKATLDEKQKEFM